MTKVSTKQIFLIKMAQGTIVSAVQSCELSYSSALAVSSGDAPTANMDLCFLCVGNRGYGENYLTNTILHSAIVCSGKRFVTHSAIFYAIKWIIKTIGGPRTIGP